MLVTTVGLRRQRRRHCLPLENSEASLGLTTDSIALLSGICSVSIFVICTKCWYRKSVVTHRLGARLPTVQISLEVMVVIVVESL